MESERGSDSSFLPSFLAKGFPLLPSFLPSFLANGFPLLPSFLAKGFCDVPSVRLFGACFFPPFPKPVLLCVVLPLGGGVSFEYFALRVRL